MTPPSWKRYAFGPFELDADDRLLMHEGTIVPLTPKALDTLLILVERNGHVVSKDELLERVWPDSFVEQNNLAQNISALRKALGEKEGGPRYIDTVPKRGYRFISPGTAQPRPEPPPVAARAAPPTRRPPRPAPSGRVHNAAPAVRPGPVDLALLSGW